MAKFGNTFSGDSAYTEMIARIEDIKAAPHHGQKRLVVREDGKRLQQTIIDIDISAGSELEEHETYVFRVSEKDEKRYGYQSRRDKNLKSYYCASAPEEYTSGSERDSTFSRFSGDPKASKFKRTRF